MVGEWKWLGGHWAPKIPFIRGTLHHTLLANIWSFAEDTPFICCKEHAFSQCGYIYIILVGGLEHFFICPCIGNNHPNRLIFFRGVETGCPSLRGYYHTIPVFLHPSPAPRSNIAGDFSHECFHCSPIKWYIPNFIFRCRNQTLQTSLVFPASWNCSPLYKVVPHS